MSEVTTFATESYFQTNQEKKILVSSDFVKRITSTYPDPIKIRGLKGVTHFKSLSSDTQNIRHMGGVGKVRKYAFTPDQIASLIDLQPNGRHLAVRVDYVNGICYM